MIHSEIPQPAPSKLPWVYASWVANVLKDATKEEAATWMNTHNVKLKVTANGWTVDNREGNGLQNWLAAPEGGGLLVASIVTAGALAPAAGAALAAGKLLTAGVVPKLVSSAVGSQHSTEVVPMVQTVPNPNYQNPTPSNGGFSFTGLDYVLLAVFLGLIILFFTLN